MGVFDGILGNWIQIKDDQCPLTIANYSYKTGVIEGTTGNHCVPCVVVNNCWFKDEPNKRPTVENLIAPTKVSDIKSFDNAGLFHPHCHCKEIQLPDPDLNDIKLIETKDKMNWTFSSKADWINSLGYNCDKNFEDAIYLAIKKAYLYGNYKIQIINKYGVKIRLYLDLPGGNEKSYKTYQIISAFMIFPNGTLKCNTILGGKIE